ncbi:MAG: hypothetical protein AAGA81_15150 [Acidobacteriota bacterium]
MTEQGSRGRRILLSCLGGCAMVFVLLIGSCVAFTVWVNSPGDILDPRLVMDPEAAGYVEWQLSLEDPGTAAIVEAFARLTDREDDLPQSQLLRGLFRYNQRRQEKELRKLFPATVVWVPYAQETGSSGDLFSVSVARMVNQSRIADWVLTRVASVADGMPTVRYKGELILSIDDADAQFHAFLHPLGVFWSNRLEVAQRAVDALQSDVESTPADGLARELAGLRGPGAIRGVLTNPEGLLVQKLRAVAEGGFDADLETTLSAVEVIALVGGPMEGGDVRLTLDLQIPEERREGVAEAVERLLADLRDGAIPLLATVGPGERGLQIDLLIEDLPGTLDEFGDEVTREIEETFEESAAERRAREVEEQTRRAEGAEEL